MVFPPLTRIGGCYYRAVVADRVEQVLASPIPGSAGRYHRPGQKALYLSPEPDWAAIAVGAYMAEDRLPRVIVPLEIDEANVVDQRDELACAVLGIDPESSNRRWRTELTAGGEPPSWRNSDAARGIGADGIIDPSRGIVGGWHVSLFRWNEPDAPQISVVGEPFPCDYASSRARWPWPEGWTLPIGL